MPKSSRSEMDAFRGVVLARDGTTCQCCGIDVTHKLASIQHRIPRGMGGSRLVNIPSNGILVCGSATTPGSCHNWMEHEDRPAAQAMGYLIPKLARIHPSRVPIYTKPHGWVLLDDAGNRLPYVGEVPA
jgi:hypothetical protein